MKISRRRNTPTSNLLGCIFSSFSGADFRAELENTFKDMSKLSFALCTSSGRQAMELALRAYGFSSGDEVVFPTITFYVLPEIVRQMGLKPVFANCSEDFNLDVSELENVCGPRTKAIVATHMFGLACDMNAIIPWAERNGIRVIEDCAHCLGVEGIGTTGDVAFFSFQNRKPVNAFGGGMLVTDDEQVYMKAREEVEKQSRAEAEFPLRLTLNYLELMLTEPHIYPLPLAFLRSRLVKRHVLNLYQRVHHRNVDKRKRFTQLQAAIALEQMRELDKSNRQRISIAQKYSRALRSLDGLVLPGQLFTGAHNCYSFIMLSENAREICDYLYRKGIDAATGEDVIRNCGRMFDDVGDYEKTDILLDRMIELPLYRQLTDADIEMIVSSVKEAVYEIC